MRYGSSRSSGCAVIEPPYRCTSGPPTGDEDVARLRGLWSQLAGALDRAGRSEG
jgi:hypothetical protein